MPKFPTKAADIKALAIAVAFGTWNHSDDFPNIDVLEIADAINQYTSARNAQNQTRAAAKLATEVKNASLKNLKDIMRNYLKKSEVDVAGDPEKLALIGWEPKAPPTPTEPPCQPQNLVPLKQSQDIVKLKWNRPDKGGAIRNYIIERREQPAGGKFGAWNIVGTALNSEINLINQPRGIQLEYRIKALNATGQSSPSNIAAAVL